MLHEILGALWLVLRFSNCSQSSPWTRMPPNVFPTFLYVSAFTVGSLATRTTPTFTNLIFLGLWLYVTPVDAATPDKSEQSSSFGVTIITSFFGTFCALALSYWICRMTTLWRQCATHASRACVRCTSHTPTLSCLMNGDTPLVSNPKWNSFRDEYRRRALPGNMRAKQFSPQPLPPMPDLASDSSLTSDSDDDRPITSRKSMPMPRTDLDFVCMETWLGDKSYTVCDGPHLAVMTPAISDMTSCDFLATLPCGMCTNFTMIRNRLCISGTSPRDVRESVKRFRSFLARRPDPNPPAARLVGIESNPGPSEREPRFRVTARRTFVINVPLGELCLNVIVAAFLSSIDYSLRRFFNVYPDDGLVVTGFK